MADTTVKSLQALHDRMGVFTVRIYPETLSNLPRVTIQNQEQWMEHCTLENLAISWVWWWCTPLTPAFGRWKGRSSAT